MLGGSDLKHHDGAGAAAQVVLAFLRRFNVEESWNDTRREYDATIEVNRWHNDHPAHYDVFDMQGRIFTVEPVNA